MSKQRWLIPLMAVGSIVLYQRWRHGALRQTAENIRAFDLPSAGMYDVLFARLIDGFYRRAAEDVAAMCQKGLVLEVGSGPGRLAAHLARTAPDLTVVGLDLSPAMVERASRRAAQAGLASRVQFQVGDATQLPFPDTHFDGLVSTFSVHHFSDPARALAEMHRVLKPGGNAWIYEVPGWLWRLVKGRVGLDQLAQASPFSDGSVEVVRWKGLAPAYVRLRLRRDRHD